MDIYYRGDEVKFSLKIEAPGFSMDDDDFDVMVKSGNSSVKGYKNAESGTTQDLVIFKETSLPAGSYRCNLSAIQAGGSKAYEILSNGEIWLVDTTNSLVDEETGVCDAYIVGDGNTAASGLKVMPGTGWFAIVDTSKLLPGTMRVVSTAYIVDAHANDGVRNDIQVAQLAKLVEP